MIFERFEPATLRTALSFIVVSSQVKDLQLDQLPEELVQAAVVAKAGDFDEFRRHPVLASLLLGVLNGPADRYRENRRERYEMQRRALAPSNLDIAIPETALS